MQTRRFPQIPERIQRLEELAYNLKWSWDYRARLLFKRLDPDVWKGTQHNPVKLLHTIESSRLLAEDAREIVALNVVSAYLEALRSKATRDTLAEQKNLADDLYKITRQRADQGAAAELDANRAMQKVNTLRKEAQEKAMGVLNANQKREWQEMIGEEFKMDFGPGGGGRRGKKKNDA